MRLRHVSFVTFCMAMLLASCATLLGPRDMEISLARLQESIASRFPFNSRYLDLIDIQVTNPRVKLLPDTNRILTSMDASVAPPFLKRSWNGNLSVSGQLRFDPARNALVLAEPRVEQFAVNGLDPLYANQITKVGALLSEQLLKDLPLYTFRPEEFGYAGTRLIPTKITTRSNSLVVTFEPAR